MFGQVIAAHKAFIANRTSESFLAGMSPQMPLQFVGTSETFATEKPIANERPFTSVPSEMSLQMRSFAINFTTARYVARVNIFLS